MKEKPEEFRAEEGSYALPHSRRSFLKGMGLSDVWTHTWPMLVIAIVTLGASVIIFNRKIA